MEEYDSGMTGMLMSMGIDKFSAQRRVSKLSNKPDATFVEVYGRGAIVSKANHARRSLDVKG